MKCEMIEVKTMYDPKLKPFYAKAIGDLALEYLESCTPFPTHMALLENALDLIAEIKEILNDTSLDDPACFARVDALVDAFYRAGLPVDRHRECE